MNPFAGRLLYRVGLGLLAVSGVSVVLIVVDWVVFPGYRTPEYVEMAGEFTAILFIVFLGSTLLGVVALSAGLVWRDAPSE